MSRSDYEDREPVNDPVSLRDYFAAKALQGLLSGKIDGEDGCFSDPKELGIEEQMQKQYTFGSQLAYGYADAMLKTREVQP